MRGVGEGFHVGDGVLMQGPERAGWVRMGGWEGVGRAHGAGNLDWRIRDSSNDDSFAAWVLLTAIGKAHWGLRRGDVE